MSGILKVALTTYAGFLCGDVISQALIQPGKKHDYGVLNKYMKRKVNSKWWNTRLEHCITIPAYAVATDLISTAMWKRIAASRGKTFSFGTMPLAFMFHSFSFILAGVMGYVVHNAYLNPNVEDPKQFIKDHTFGVVSGSMIMWMFPLTVSAMGKFSAAVPALTFLFNNAGGATIQFLGFKALAHKEYKVPEALTPFERELNKKEEKADI